jgi:hypothetical protein
MSDSHVDYGTQGAYRSTWRKAQPRLLLERLVNEHRKATEEEIHKLFWEEIEEDSDMLRACIEYWLDNNYASILRFKPLPKGKIDDEPRSVPTQARQLKEQIKRRIERETHLALLNLLMPNGKVLGDCTGQECLQFGRWFANLAKQVPPTEIVRDVLSENQVFKVWKAAQK